MISIIGWAVIAWALYRHSGVLQDFVEWLARMAAYVYTLGVVTREAVEAANDWLADRVTGRRPWFTTPAPAPAPLAAETVFGSAGFIILDEPALEAECLTFEAPAAKPAKRRRTRATKAAAGG